MKFSQLLKSKTVITVIMTILLTVAITNSLTVKRPYVMPIIERVQAGDHLFIPNVNYGYTSRVIVENNTQLRYLVVRVGDEYQIVNYEQLRK